MNFSRKLPKDIKWSYLILAFILSVTLWFYVTVQDNPAIEQLFDVPVDYTNLEDGLAIGEKVETVKVRVSGSKNIMNDLTASDINAAVDLAGLDLGSHTVRLDVKLPSGVQLISVDQTEIMLIIEQLEHIQRPVEVTFGSSKAAEGYMVLDPVLMPGEIMLAGSADKLALVDRVYVTADLKDATENYRATLPVKVTDVNGNSLLSWVTPQPASVDVLAPVVGDQPSKVAPVRVTISGEPAEGYIISRIVADPAVATVLGPQNVLDNLDYVYTSAVNISGATGTVKDEVTLLSVDGATIDSSINFGVMVVIEKQRTVTLKDVAVSLSRANSNYNYQLDRNTVDVTVTGPVSAINELVNTDIEARVDVGNLSPGEASVSVVLSTGKNVEIVQAEPTALGVSVSRK